MSTEFPNRWDQWPREAKVDYLSLQQSREELLGYLRGYLGSDRDSDRLSKMELAMITVDLEIQK
jgi:hypothetical protein